MSSARFVSVVVLLTTLLALIINLAQPYSINLGSFKYNFPGINLEFLPGFKDSNRLAFRKGLDLEGGTSVTLKAEMTGIPENQRDNALDAAKDVIERRINFFGVSEPVIQTAKVSNEHRINVEIPGVTDTDEAIKLIGKTAKLTFWEEGQVATESALLTATEAAKLASESGVPLGIIRGFGPGAKKTDLTGADLKQANVTFDPSTGNPQVALEFNSKGSKKFADITKRNIGKSVAIALDDQVITAPSVNEAIFGGSAVISGNFTTQEAKNLQIQLNAGALPISLSIIRQSATGASLGEASLQKSLFAGVIGFGIIVIFMVVLYGRLGIVASLALVVYTLIVLALFRLIPVTLTLAGIAGFILSIGVAVDANILIFERMKEEMRRGLSHEKAVELGFSRAWPSIRDSNISSIITSAILYYFGTAIVKGFAFTLAIGVIVSMFSAITVTRTLLRWIYKN